MTIDEAARIVMTADLTDATSVDMAELGRAVAVLRERALEMDDESQRERAMWISANHDRPRDDLNERMRNMALVDTFTPTPGLQENRPQPAEVISFIEGALTLVAVIAALKDQVSADRQRWLTASLEVRGRRVDGLPLLHGGGHQYFLGGTPVHPGDELHLLTTAGWMEGTYRAAVDAGPLFVFSLPGAPDAEVTCPILPGARLARTTHFRHDTQET
jgi:hypothetical protein